MRLFIGQLCLALILAAAFVILHRLVDYPEYVLPSPGTVADYIAYSWLSLVRASLSSFALCSIGFALGLAVALTTAILIRGSRRSSETALAIGVGWQTYPIIAIAPVLFVLFGDGWVTRLIIVASLAYFPCFLAFVAAGSTRVDAVEGFFEQIGRWPPGGRFVLRLNHFGRSIESAVIGSAALALIGAIVAEFLAGDSGLGYLIRHGQDLNHTEVMLASILAIAVCGAIYFPAIQFVVRQTLPGARISP